MNPHGPNRDKYPSGMQQSMVPSSENNWANSSILRPVNLNSRHPSIAPWPNATVASAQPPSRQLLPGNTGYYYQLNSHQSTQHFSLGYQPNSQPYQLSPQAPLQVLQNYSQAYRQTYAAGTSYPQPDPQRYDPQKLSTPPPSSLLQGNTPSFSPQMQLPFSSGLPAPNTPHAEVTSSPNLSQTTAQVRGPANYSRYQGKFGAAPKSQPRCHVPDSRWPKSSAIEHPVQDDDLYPGCIVWPYNVKAGDSRRASPCIQDHASSGVPCKLELMVSNDDAWDHPVIVLETRERDGSDGLGKKWVIAVCCTTFTDKNIDTYIEMNEQDPSLNGTAIPIYNRKFHKSNEDKKVQMLYLAKGSYLKKETFVRTVDVFLFPSVYLRCFGYGCTRAFDRLIDPDSVQYLLGYMKYTLRADFEECWTASSIELNQPKEEIKFRPPSANMNESMGGGVYRSLQTSQASGNTNQKDRGRWLGKAVKRRPSGPWRLLDSTKNDTS